MPTTPTSLLGGLTAAQFLTEYWQKKPLLVRQAIPGFTSALTTQELAGLACEDGIESRLILEKDGPSPWSLEHGPFSEERFTSLPETHWTLLVQEVNKVIPQVSRLLEQFKFIPDWRVDDVMISYAPYMGSVGPHVDQYDVFLLQAQGQRRWQINYEPVAEDNYIPDIELNIMREFSSQQEWLLQPGDMLYLPPAIAHYGVAMNDCITYSIGFRAPSHSEILTAFTDEMVTHLADSQRYGDADLDLQQHSSEINTQALEKIHHIIRNSFSDSQIENWFGRYITEPKSQEWLHYPEQDYTAAEFELYFKQQSQFYRNQASRLAFIENDAGLRLFVDGELIELPAEHRDFVIWLGENHIYRYDSFVKHKHNNANLEIMTHLYNQGVLLTEIGDE